MLRNGNWIATSSSHWVALLIQYQPSRNQAAQNYSLRKGRGRKFRQTNANKGGWNLRQMDDLGQVGTWRSPRGNAF